MSTLIPKRVLFIATRQIGDVLITTPLISKARALWPDAEFHFLGYRGKLDMLKGNPDIQEWIETSDHPGLAEYWRLFCKIFQRYDLAFVTQPSDRAYFYGSIAALRRVGVVGAHPQGKGKDNKNAWKKAISMHTVEVDYFKQHVIVEKLRLLEPFYPTPAIANQTLFEDGVWVTPPTAEALSSHIAKKLRAPYVVIHPGPLTAYKRWPLGHWKTVIEWLSAQGLQVVLSASPAQQDLDLNRDILTLLNVESRANVIDTQGQLNLAQAGTLLRNALFYIGVDTSISHLAAACNTNTIALFGPTPPSNFGPWPNGFAGTTPYHLRARSQTVDNITILQGPGECVPCRKAGCDDHVNSRSECLNLLEPELVIAAAKSFLRDQ
jgi:heptosyltransferase III